MTITDKKLRLMIGDLALDLCRDALERRKAKAAAFDEGTRRKRAPFDAPEGKNEDTDGEGEGEDADFDYDPVGRKDPELEEDGGRGRAGDNSWE